MLPMMFAISYFLADMFFAVFLPCLCYAMLMRHAAYAIADYAITPPPPCFSAVSPPLILTLLRICCCRHYFDVAALSPPFDISPPPLFTVYFRCRRFAEMTRLSRCHIDAVSI